jgi:hypothetical protein
MNYLWIILAIVGIVLLVWGLGAALQALLWIGVVLLVIAIVLFLVRTLGGRRV